MSSKTPGRDLEDRWSLDRVSDVGSWWNFHRSFWSMIPIIWHHLQVHQESTHPPRLQKETWRIGGALTGFLLFPSFSGTSTFSRTPGRDLEDRWSLERVSDVRSWWNFLLFPSFQEPPHPPRLQGETWRTGGVFTDFWCWILMKLSQKLLNDDPYHMTHPPRLQGETWRTGGVLTGFLMLDLDETF